MRIPLVKNGKTVAEVKFTGTGAITVQGSVKAVDGNTEDAARLRDLVSLSKGMAQSDVSSPLGPVRYWTGFWGWLSGLSVVTPSLGIFVDWNAIEYP